MNDAQLAKELDRLAECEGGTRSGSERAAEVMRRAAARLREVSSKTPAEHYRAYAEAVRARPPSQQPPGLIQALEKAARFHDSLAVIGGAG